MSAFEGEALVEEACLAVGGAEGQIFPVAGEVYCLPVVPEGGEEGGADAAADEEADAVIDAGGAGYFFFGDFGDG